MGIRSGAAGVASGGAFGLIFATILLDILGATLLMPVMAFVVREYSTDALAVGLLSVIYSAAQFLATPLLGRLSDRHGRRPVLLICLLGSAFGYALFGVGGALWVLFLSRLIDGVTGGNLSVAQAYIADVTPPEERAKRFALVGGAFGLGFILGPALGGALGQISLAAPAYAAGGLSLLAAAVGYFVLPESLPPERRSARPPRLAELNPLAAIAGMARRPRVGRLLLASSAFTVAFSGMTSIIAVLLIERFAVDPAGIATLFTAGGLVSMLMQAGFVYRFAPRLGERRLALAGLLLLVAGYAGMAAAPSLAVFFPVSVLSWVGNALVLPTLMALVSNAVPAQEQGEIAGVHASLGSLMGALGPLLAGAVYDLVAPGASLWAGAALLAAAWLLVRRARAGERADGAVQ